MTQVVANSQRTDDLLIDGLTEKVRFRNNAKFADNRQERSRLCGGRCA
jgi:hypothetical protein